MLNKICTRTAKSAPYPPCTVTAFWLKKRDSARCLRRVTQPPHIAGPLAKMKCAVLIGLAPCLDSSTIDSKLSFTWMENALAHQVPMIDMFEKWISNTMTDFIAGQFFC